MAKKKPPAPVGPPDIPVEITDIAGMIHLQTRNLCPQSRSETRELLKAAERVSRLWASRLPPNVIEIEAELKNGPFDAYFILGMIEVSRRYECEFRETLRKRMEENRGKLNALVGHIRSPKQETKRFIGECWLEWQQRKALGNDPYPKGKTQFATDVLTKLDDDQKVSLKTITDTWCREWEREAEIS